MTKRILHLVADWGPSAATKQLRLLREQAAQQGWTMCVVALDNHCATADLSADLQARHPGRVDVAFIRNLRTLAREFRPQIVHTWNMSPTQAARWTWLAGNRGQLVVSSRQVDLHWQEFGSQMLRRLGTPIARLLAPGEAMAKVLRQQYAGAKVDVIADALPERDPVPEGFNARRTLGLPDDARLLLCVAQLNDQSALKDVIWSLDLLTVIRKDVHLAIIGDGPWRAQLLRYRHVVQLDERVHFLGRHDQLTPWLAQADVFVQPGAFLAPPLALLQAATERRPIAAAESVGLRGVVCHAKSGRLVRYADRAAMAREINRLLDDRNLAEALGAAAAENVSTAHSPAAVVARYAQCYAELTPS